MLSFTMTDDLSSLLRACERLELGTVVLVRSVEEAHQAVSDGARSVCLESMDEDALVEARHSLSYPLEQVQLGARLRAEGDFSTFAEGTCH